jgi:hypothetical protein
LSGARITSRSHSRRSGGRLRDRQHRALLPARPPGNQAKPAADITDWTALTPPDDFFAAAMAACRAESVPTATVPETERRLAGGVLQARELHPVGSSGSPLGCTLGVGSVPSTPMTKSSASVLRSAA